jgi:hypothetical protein
MLLSLLLTLYTIHKKRKQGMKRDLLGNLLDPFFKNIRPVISKLSNTLKKVSTLKKADFKYFCFIFLKIN